MLHMDLEASDQPQAKSSYPLLVEYIITRRRLRVEGSSSGSKVPMLACTTTKKSESL